MWIKMTQHLFLMEHICALEEGSLCTLLRIMLLVTPVIDSHRTLCMAILLQPLSIAEQENKMK